MSTGLKQTAQCLGYAQYQTLTAAQGLTADPDVGHALPLTDPSAYGNRPLFALLQAESKDVRWTDDGTTPTASTGMVLFAGDAPYPYDGDLTRLLFIETAASGILNVSYYR